MVAADGGGIAPRTPGRRDVGSFARHVSGASGTIPGAAACAASVGADYSELAKALRRGHARHNTGEGVGANVRLVPRPAKVVSVFALSRT